MNIEILSSKRNGIVAHEIAISKTELLTARNSVKAMESLYVAIGAYLGFNNYAFSLSAVEFENTAISFMNAVCRKQFDKAVFYILESKTGEYEFKTWILKDEEETEVPNEFVIHYVG